MNQLLKVAGAVCVTLIAFPAHSGGYTEGPDVSNDRTAPTAITLDVGSNLIQGTSGYSGAVLDRDFFKITVIPGAELVEIFLGSDTQPGGAFSFMGVQAGSSLTVDPDTITSGQQLLGWHLYGSADVGTNILDEMGGGPDKIGFTGPLPAGAYTFWVQELAPVQQVFPPEPYPPYPYQFDFRVAAVPEPSTYALIGLGLGMVGFALNRPVRKGRLG